MGNKTKQTGKTEVYPFWYMEDIKNMMDYFRMKGMWHWYLAFNFGLLLGRRVGDTLAFKWSDFFYENGRMKDEFEIKEQKTGKVTRLYVCEACKTALRLYIDKTNIDPMENYNDFIITTPQKSQLLQDKDKYTNEEWDKLFWMCIYNRLCSSYFLYVAYSILFISRQAKMVSLCWDMCYCWIYLLLLLCKIRYNMYYFNGVIFWVL